MLDWADPLRLSEYRQSPRGQGIYIIGRPGDPDRPIEVSKGYDPYMGRWPENLFPLYVGISESMGRGVRSRLSLHARKKGNRCIAQHIDKGTSLWFVTISSTGMANFEALYLCLQSGEQFECNVRSELERSAKRLRTEVRADLTQSELDYYDNLDMGEHGEGM